MKSLVVDILKRAVAEKGVKLKEEEISALIEVPKTSELGDYAFPCFSLAKQLKESPHEIAKELREKIGNVSEEFEDVFVQGPYLNFFFNKKWFALSLINSVLKEKENYGKSNLGEKKTSMFEFSQPNTHKAFHVGHIRGTSIGESLSRIAEFSGEKVIRANYSGDTGMHIARWIWCYAKYHSKEKLKSDEAWIASIYVDAMKRLGKNKKFSEEVNRINQELETKENKELNELWNKTREDSIESWKKIYSELNTRFDVHIFESEVEKRGKEIGQELLKKGIAKMSEGAVIVDMQDKGMGVWVVLRSDGTVLYSAKDLALMEWKSKNYEMNRYLVVVGDEQDFYFKQLFKVAELSKAKNYERFGHIPFGMVRLPSGKMSSRTGDNILYSDFVSELGDYAKKEIKKRDAKLDKKKLEERALKISIAAIKYAFLKQSPGKMIIFDKKTAMNFEGDTGPYVQYSYARASSILKKVKKASANSSLDISESEYELAKKLSRFPFIVRSAYESLNPAIIANYSYELAKLFNEFYHACPVMNSSQQEFRLHLVEAFRLVLKNAFDLLGIDVLEEM